MALNIPIYPNHFHQSVPLENAYGWIAGISLDISNNTGSLVLNIHPEESAWASIPVAQLSVYLGQPGSSGNFPTLTDLFNDSEFLNAYNIIGGKMYLHLLNLHLPELSGAMVV